MIFFSSPSTDPCQEQNRTSDPKIPQFPVDSLGTSLLPFYATLVALKDLVFSTPYFPMGGGMASVISKYLPTVDATAEVTSASVDNCLLVGAKKADIAFTMADVGWDAYLGIRRRFEGWKNRQGRAFAWPPFLRPPMTRDLPRLSSCVLGKDVNYRDAGHEGRAQEKRRVKGRQAPRRFRV